MPWLHHPSYVRVRDRLVERFKDKAFVFRKLRHVVFICGGFQSTRRLEMIAYMRRWCTDAIVFQADDVWAEIATKNPTLNALALEEQLARLADMLLIVVESPGTYAELGAFSISSHLRRKLLPIVDATYEGRESFINTGPVNWVNDDSMFRPAVYVPLDSILEAGSEVTNRLGRLPTPKESRIDDLAAHPKHLMFLIHDLVAIIGPSSSEHVAFILSAILGKEPVQSVASLLGMAKALGLLRSFPSGGQLFYLANADSYFAKPFVTKKYFDLNTERAKVLSVLQTISGAREVMKQGAASAQGESRQRVVA